MAYFLKAILIVIHLKLNKKYASVFQEGKEHEELRQGASQWPALSPAPTAPHASLQYVLHSPLQGSLRNVV